MAERFSIEWAPVAFDDLDDILEYIASTDTYEAAEHIHRRILQQS